MYKYIYRQRYDKLDAKLVDISLFSVIFKMTIMLVSFVSAWSCLPSCTVTAMHLFYKTCRYGKSEHDTKFV